MYSEVIFVALDIHNFTERYLDQLIFGIYIQAVAFGRTGIFPVLMIFDGLIDRLRKPVEIDWFQQVIERIELEAFKGKLFVGRGKDDHWFYFQRAHQVEATDV